VIHIADQRLNLFAVPTRHIRMNENRRFMFRINGRLKRDLLPLQVVDLIANQDRIDAVLDRLNHLGDFLFYAA
jgi:hypothetical protein